MLHSRIAVKRCLQALPISTITSARVAASSSSRFIHSSCLTHFAQANPPPNSTPSKPPNPLPQQPPQSSNAQQKPSSSSSAAPTPPTFPSYPAVLKYTNEQLATALYALPMFQSTCRSQRVSRTDSSLPCTDILSTIDNSLVSTLEMESQAALFGMQLSNYVQVEIEVQHQPSLFSLMTSAFKRGTVRYDFIDGSQEAFLYIADLFNTFHLESSRTELYKIARPQVFTAFETAWKQLDAGGMRMKWSVDVKQTSVKQFHFHNSDDFDAGAEGGLRVPVMPNPGIRVGGSGTSGSAGNNTKMTISDSTPDSSTKTSSSAGSTLPPIRYVDLDIQFDVHEKFELFTIREDQTPEVKKSNETTLKAANATPTELKPNEKEHIKTTTATNILDQIAQTQTQASEWQGANTDATATNKTSSSPASSPATPSPATDAATPTPTSSPSSTPAANLAPSSTTTSKSLDYPPPLRRFFVLECETERGLRFYSPLPEPQRMTESETMKNFVMQEMNTTARANWIVKDILT